MNILFLTAYRLTDKDTREKINEDSRRFLKWDEDCKGMSPLKRFTRCCREQEFPLCERISCCKTDRKNRIPVFTG